MLKLLGVLIVLTAACGLAASITITLAPAYTDASSDGYELSWRDNQ